MNLRRIQWLFVLLVMVAACADENGPGNGLTYGIRADRSLAEYETAATNVSPYDTDAHPDFSPVVSLVYSLNGSQDFDHVASGVLIDEEWVLTAGHNFFVSDDQSNPAPAAGITVNFGNDPNNPDRTLGTTELVFHPTWLDNDDGLSFGNDFCLVRLSSPVSNITPALYHDGSDEPLGSISWFCGFGDYSRTSGQDPDLYSLKHVYENELDRKTTGLISQDRNGNTYSGGLLAYDFDDPDGSINALGDGFSSTDEQALGSGNSSAGARPLEGATIQGDSGGPLFVRIGNEWRVVGILNGGASEPVPNHADGDYGDISIFCRVSNNSDWIDSVIN